MKKTIRKQAIIAMMGLFLLALTAIFCYRRVEKTIIGNEQEGLKSLAKVNAQSMESSLYAKSEKIFSLFSGDMETESEIEATLLKLGEKGKYVESDYLAEEGADEIIKGAVNAPWEVIIGPIIQSESGGYILYMTKAVSVSGKITGVVQIEIDLDDFYANEQALSSLEVANSRYCIVKDSDGETIMPSDHAEGNISISQTMDNGCTIAWIYEANGVTPERTRKLIAYENIEIGSEELVLYIIEDYDQLVKPIEQIALYLCLIGVVLILIVVGFMYSIYDHQKKEAILEKELQHEKTLNETMKKQEGLMQKYNHSKTMGVLTGAIAHEFNNLMTPIVLYADLLEENEIVKQEMPEEVTELKSAAFRCEELARQLLSYSRQGKAEKVLTDYDATYAVNEAVSMVQKLIPSNIQLKTTICKTAYYIHGQVGTLNQILLNLTTNAIHAMKDGGVLKIQFGLSTDNEKYVRLIVEDTGTGIPEEIQAKVFQPFFTTKQPGEGTGIGLTVVTRLTQEHGGRVRAKTEEGKGTMFILDFPRVRQKE
ncbi:MAG: ATP-binding protein [Eubacteriales bacterium]|nr:ATP-binding protein [Eubacteriales bacterium]